MTSEPEATARAHVNVALVKYWGKRDAALFLPWTSSLSMTLDAFWTTTAVRFHAEPGEDEVTLDGEPLAGEQLRRVTGFLDLARSRAGHAGRAVVNSVNAVPTGAGLVGGFAVQVGS